MAIVLASPLGDVFWDLLPLVTYIPDTDIGCTIFVANPSDVGREYSLNSSLLTPEGAVISEEAVTVFGHSWFNVHPGGFVKLHGAFRLNESNIGLVVHLIDRETDVEIDSVSTWLVEPIGAVDGAFPPGWPEPEPGFGIGTPIDMIGEIIPFLMFAMMGMLLVSAFKPGERAEKGVITHPKGRPLPPRRK